MLKTFLPGANVGRSLPSWREGALKHNKQVRNNSLKNAFFLTNLENHSISNHLYHYVFQEAKLLYCFLICRKKSCKLEMG